MQPRIVIALVSTTLVAAFATPANAQYIARKLQRDSHLVTASGISGNRVVGGYGAQFGVRNRYDGALWDATTGIATYVFNGATTYRDVSNDWVVKDGGDFRIFTSYNPYSAVNLVTGESFALGYSSSSQSSGYDQATPGMRGNWAWANQQNHVFGSFAYYDIFSSRLVNLQTGEIKNYSWNAGSPFSYVNRQFVDVSDGKILQNFYGTYSLRDIATNAETGVTTGLSGIVGMSGRQIAGNTVSGAGLHDYATNQTMTLSKVGMTTTAMKQIGVGESAGSGTNATTNQQNALRWDNTSGAVTNLHHFLGSAYTASSVISLDKANANGPILVSADRAGGTDFVALRQFAGTVVGVGEGEIATFEDDHAQTGGVVVNQGTIQWTNPPRWWNLQSGLLTGTGNFGGNINNSGGSLSGGGAGGGTGGGSGGGTGGGGFGGDGGAGSGIGAFSATGSYLQSGNGTLLVSIGGATAFDTFTFGGGATLGGILEISLLNGYVPTFRQEFAFFSAPNTVGTWEAIHSPGHDWQVRYAPNGATLIYNGVAAVAVPETGSAVLGLLGLLSTVAVYMRRNRS